MERRRVQTVIDAPSLTHASAAAQCDVNRIVARARKTGMWPENMRKVEYIDVSEVGDYRESLEKIRNGERIFGSLPSEIRNRFNNDLGQLVTFLGNPANLPEAVKLGLAKAPEKAPAKVQEAVKDTPKG